MTNMHDDDQDLLVPDEVRWEWARGSENPGSCNCGPYGDGPPCPHGHYDVQYKKTEAEWAKEVLEEWEYEEDEDEDEEPDEDYFLELDGAPEELDQDPEEEEAEGIFGVNTMAPTFKGTSSSQVELEAESSEWFFNDATGEWEER